MGVLYVVRYFSNDSSAVCRVDITLPSDFLIIERFVETLQDPQLQSASDTVPQNSGLSGGTPTQPAGKSINHRDRTLA